MAALIGNPLVGAAFILELGRRRSVPLGLERVTAALAGGLVGWSINVAFGLELIRLNVPDVAPEDLPQAIGTAVLVGLVAGALTSLTGSAIYPARGWQAPRAPPRLSGEQSSLIVLDGLQCCCLTRRLERQFCTLSSSLSGATNAMR